MVLVKVVRRYRWPEHIQPPGDMYLRLPSSAFGILATICLYKYPAETIKVKYLVIQKSIQIMIAHDVYNERRK